MPIDSIVQGVTSVTRTTPAGTTSSTPRPSSTAPARQELPPEQTVPAAGDDEAARAAELNSAVSNLNDYVQSLRRELQFSVDDGSGHTVVKVMDPGTGEMIRQIPSEEVLAIARSLEQTQGLLLNTKV
jgi:flagellar protein FlaG